MSEIPNFLERFKGLAQEMSRPVSAYDLGRDCALHGANTVNCHFTIFASREQTTEWERGKASVAQEETP